MTPLALVLITVLFVVFVPFVIAVAYLILRRFL